MTHLVQFDPAVECELHWYFERGRDPELTPAQRRRWVPVHRALNGGGCSLRMYFAALSAGRTRAEAQVAAAYLVCHGGVVCEGGSRPEHDLTVLAVGDFRTELADFVRRFSAPRQRGRPADVPRDFIVVTHDALLAAIPVRKSTVHERGQLRQIDDAHPQSLIDAALSRGEITASTWGDLRIDRHAADGVARLIGVPLGRSAREALAAIEARLVVAEAAAPAPASEPTSPLPDKDHRDLYWFFRSLGMRAPDLLWSRSEHERKVGAATTTVSELAAATTLSNTTIRNLLGITYGEVLCRDRVPVSWLSEDGARPFWRQVDAAVRRAEARRPKPRRRMKPLSLGISSSSASSRNSAQIGEKRNAAK